MAGVGSRRHCDRLIKEGRVEVNGEKALHAGLRIDTARDAVRVDGRAVVRARSRITLVLNKPRGVLVTLKDPEGRRTVASLLPDIPGRVFPVGRLDRDSEGLLLLTNDGDLAHRVAHPRFSLPKTYRVVMAGMFSGRDLARLREGVVLREGRARPRSARVVLSSPERSEVELVLIEGWNREIRRMFARLGFEVECLVRIGLGSLTLEGLGSGQWRLLGPEETTRLLAEVGLEDEMSLEDTESR